jgi:hypothetical protein
VFNMRQTEIVQYGILWPVERSLQYRGVAR